MIMFMIAHACENKQIGMEEGGNERQANIYTKNVSERRVSDKCFSRQHFVTFSTSADPDGGRWAPAKSTQMPDSGCRGDRYGWLIGTA